LEEDGDYKEKEVTDYMATFFAIFYVDDTFLASQDAGFLQHALTLLVDLFEQVGLQAKTTKTQMLVCTLGHIRTQLPSESYRQMQTGRVTASEWNSCNVECHQCGKELKASSLGHHLVDVHDIYQQAVIAKELLETRPLVLYTVSAELHTQDLPCPYPGCLGRLHDRWMMRQHFRDVHPMDLIRVPKEGKFDHCEQCGMQVHPLYPHHRRSKECQIGVEHRLQREAAVTSALALHQQFTVRGDVLQQVEVYKYLGRMMAQDDDDIQGQTGSLQQKHTAFLLPRASTRRPR
jgi:hypothetical protein